jgi:hypothetical protein
MKTIKITKDNIDYYFDKIIEKYSKGETLQKISADLNIYWKAVKNLMTEKHRQKLTYTKALGKSSTKGQSTNFNLHDLSNTDYSIF